MSDRQYILLLNAAVKAHLVGLAGRQKRRLREKFEFLENGLWDSGVRVKKLKGISDKVVFEARATGSERILFTLGNHAGRTAVYVWGVVTHEEVQAEAHKILPQNAPFLHFEPMAQQDLAEVSLDELPADYFTTEDIAEKSPDDHGPQKWLVLRPEEWKRILLATDPDGMEIFLFLTPAQQEVLGREPPVLLAGTAGSGKTTIAVYYLLGKSFRGARCLFLTYSPYLKRFSERIYDGLVRYTKHEKAEARPDFLVFRELLLGILEGRSARYAPGKEAGFREFEEIFRQHRLHRKYDAELVWEEIRSIIKGAKPPVSVDRFRRLVRQALGEGSSRAGRNELKEILLGIRHLEIMEKIERLVAVKAGYRSYEEFLLALESGAPAPARGSVPSVLEEILRVLEKKAAAITEPLLTLREYVTLGRKRAPNFVYDREEIYSVAQFYQEKLEAQGLWDEIDLCKGALQVLGNSADRFRYDLVVCDEVQDFSDVQLALIFRLARDGRSLVLAGDAKQIINPSGFRWEEVKSKFYDRGMAVPEVLRLNLNFRCVGSIVKLANALLDLKQELVGLSDTEIREDWKFSGKPPVLIYGVPEADLLENVRLTGAGQIVLTRSREEQQKLKRLLGTELVFTISEAKGLEFDSVLLWNLSQDRKAADLWRKIGSGEGLDPGRRPHVRHELSLLYVAVTRARNTLVIYDGPTPGNVWGLERFQDMLYRSCEKGALAEVWQRVSTPAEWESQGDYFLERRHYPAAVECYKNANNTEKAEIAEAFALEAGRRHAEAAQLFELHGIRDRAAENYEKAGLYGPASDLWQALGEGARALTCRILGYEQEGAYERAAEEWEKLGRSEKALENWEKAGSHGRIARYHLARKHYGKAAEAFARAKEYGTAASCYRKAGKRSEAADCHLKAGDYRSAAALYKSLKRPERLLECYRALGDHHAAGLLYEKAKRLDEAIESFRRFAEAADGNRSLLLAEAQRKERQNPLSSAMRYSSLSLFEKSAPIYAKKGLHDRAIMEYRSVDNHLALAEVFEKTGRWREAALELERAQGEKDWVRIRHLLTNDLRAREARSGVTPQQGRRLTETPADRLCREADDMFQAGAVENALVRYMVLNYPEAVSRACRTLGRHEDAIYHFFYNRLPAEGLRYLEDAGHFEVSAGMPARLAESVFTLEMQFMPEGREFVDIVIRLLRLRLRANREDLKTIGLAENFLRRISYPYCDEKRLPDSFFDLALERRSYNTIFLAISEASHRNPSPRIRSFVEAVRKEGEACDDRGLLACCCRVREPARFDALLEGLAVTDTNFELFAGSALHYGKAVEHLAGRGRLELAVRTCRRYRDYMLAGSIQEEAGELAGAGKDYREGKLYEDALRCYRQVGDQQGIARAYEGMKRYGEALAIWTRLGKQRDVARVRGKLSALAQEPLKFK
ncbi:MAG: UvrD-helicase domain-containing protein [bacterium]